MNQWLPIETAPENGQFLVYMPNEPRHKIQAAEWHPNVKVIGNHFAFDLTKPTHWMPLPKPPTAEDDAPVRYSSQTGGAYAELNEVVSSEVKKLVKQRT